MDDGPQYAARLQDTVAFGKHVPYSIWIFQMIEEMFCKNICDAFAPERQLTAQINLYVGLASTINIYPSRNGIGSTPNLNFQVVRRY